MILRQPLDVCNRVVEEKERDVDTITKSKRHGASVDRRLRQTAANVSPVGVRIHPRSA